MFSTCCQGNRNIMYSVSWYSIICDGPHQGINGKKLVPVVLVQDVVCSVCKCVIHSCSYANTLASLPVGNVSVSMSMSVSTTLMSVSICCRAKT